MTIVYRAAANNGGSSSPRSVNKPAGVTTGDLLILQIVLQLSDAVPTPPAGYTLVAGSEVGTTYNTRLYTKVAAADEPASYEFSWTVGGYGWAVMAAVYSDVGATIQAEDVAVQVNASSTNRTFPSVSPTSAASFLLCAASLAAATTSTPDAAMTERWDTGTIQCYGMTQSLSAAGPTGTRVATGVAVASRTISVIFVETATLAAPTDLTATTISASRIDLTWTDNSDGEDGFRVERSADGLSGWTEIGTVGPGITAYSDTSLSRGEPYYYRVRAYQE